MRSITGAEYDAFVADHPALNHKLLPPWGGVIQWGDKAVLVYFAQQTDNWIWPDTYKLFLTDVTDNPAILSAAPPTFDPYTLYWWYHLPEEVVTSMLNASDTITSIASGIAQVFTPQVLIPLAVIVMIVAWNRR